MANPRNAHAIDWTATVTGTKALPNGLYGIVDYDFTANNRIGTDGDGLYDDFERNVISGNGIGGVTTALQS